MLKSLFYIVCLVLLVMSVGACSGEGDGGNNNQGGNNGDNNGNNNQQDPNNQQDQNPDANDAQGDPNANNNNNNNNNNQEAGQPEENPDVAGGDNDAGDNNAGAGGIGVPPVNNDVAGGDNAAGGNEVPPAEEVAPPQGNDPVNPGENPDNGGGDPANPADPINLCGNNLIDVGEVCDDTTVFCNQCQDVLYQAFEHQQLGNERVSGMSLNPTGSHLIVGTVGANDLYTLTHHYLSQNRALKNLGSYNLVAMGVDPIIFSTHGDTAFFSTFDEANRGFHLYRYLFGNANAAPEELNLPAPENVTPMMVVYSSGLEYYYIGLIPNPGDDGEFIPALVHVNRLRNIATLVADNLEMDGEITPVVIGNAVYFSRVTNENNIRRAHLYKAHKGDNGFVLTNLTANLDPTNFLSGWAISPNNQFAVVILEIGANTYKYTINKIDFQNNNARSLLLTFKRTAGLDNTVLAVHPNGRHLLFNTRDGERGAGPHNLYSFDLQNGGFPILLSQVTNNPQQSYKLSSGNIHLKIAQDGALFFMADRVDETPQPTFQVLKALPDGSQTIVYSSFLPDTAEIRGLILSKNSPSVTGLLWRNDQNNAGAITLKKNYE